MNRTSKSGQSHVHSQGQKQAGKKGRKPRNFFFTLLLALLPILIISGMALSSFLSRPPELPPHMEGEIGGITEDEAGGGTNEYREITEETNQGASEGASKNAKNDSEGASEGASEGPNKGANEGGIDGTTEENMIDSDDMPAGPPKQLKDNFYTFVLTGIDYEGYHTDTIMVVSLDTAARKVNLISVPRDSQVDVPRDYKKINAAYAYGGTKELKRELKSILGFAPQYYIRVHLEAFPKLVDAVGGVEFDVPQDMNYDDPSQDLHIHLVEGPQLLDGEQALQLVRYRGYLNADLGRIEVQQKFLKALAREVLSPSNIINIGTFIDIFRENVQTDISLRDLQWFARQVVKLNPETDIIVQTLPSLDDGGFYKGQHYLFLSPEGVIDMVNRTVNPYTTEITLDDVNIVRIEDNPEVTDEMIKDNIPIPFIDDWHTVLRKMLYYHEYAKG